MVTKKLTIITRQGIRPVFLMHLNWIQIDEIQILIRQEKTRKISRISSKGTPICFWFCYSFGGPRSRGRLYPTLRRFTKKFRVKFYPRDVFGHVAVRIMSPSRIIMALLCYCAFLRPLIVKRLFCRAVTEVRRTISITRAALNVRIYASVIII